MQQAASFEKAKIEMTCLRTYFATSVIHDLLRLNVVMERNTDIHSVVFIHERCVFKMCR